MFDRGNLSDQRRHCIAEGTQHRLDVQSDLPGLVRLRFGRLATVLVADLLPPTIRLLG